MRVAIDIRRITEFGVGTYTRNAIRTLARLDHENEYLLIGIPDNIGPRGRRVAHPFPVPNPSS